MPLQNSENQPNGLDDDLFDIMEEGDVDDRMLTRLIETILKDLVCTEVSLWTINRNNKWVDGTSRSEEDKYLSTSLICRSKSEECKYEFTRKQEFTHSLKQKCLFADIVNNVSTKKPFKHFSSKDAIDEGFTSRDFIEKANIEHIYVIPVTENDKSGSSIKEAMAIVELSFSNRDTIPVDKDMRNHAKRIHSACYLALSKYMSLQKQRLINGLINRLIELHSRIDVFESESLCLEIINSIREFLPCQGASFFLKDSFRNNYCLKASTGVCYTSSNIEIDKGIYNNVRYQKGEGLTGMVAENGRIFISDDLAKDKERPHYSKTYEKVQGDKEDDSQPPLKRIKTGMFIPIISTQDRNNVIGIIRLVNKNNKCNSDIVDFFDDVDADIMDFASKYLSAIVESRLNAEQLRSFESRMSHEVLKPTGNILLYAGLLKDVLREEEMYKDKIKERLEKIKKQAERQRHNLKVIKILYGEGYDSCGDTDGSDLHSIICKSWEETEPIANRYNIQEDIFENEVSKHKFMLRVDANAFIMAFSNLFENAIKYFDESEDTWIRVTATPWFDGTLHIIVSDNGIGISTDELESVFNEGYRGRNVQDNDGSGLGLPTVRRIIEDFKGTIEIKKGRKPTTFEIVLPKEIVHYNNKKK